MKELQGLLGEANQFLEHADVQVEVPVTHPGTFYEVSSTVVPVPQTVGRIEQIDTDYQNRREGIGTVAPEILGFPELLRDVQSAASKITAIHSRYQRTMHDMTWLCFNHIEHEFPGEARHLRGGLFRIQITAKTAVFQILFPVGHGFYAPSHEIDLSEIAESDAFRRQPFSQIPPNIMIPAADHSGTYVPATYAGWKATLDDIPLNSKKKPTQMFRSHTADVFESFGGMVEELLVA